METPNSPAQTPASKQKSPLDTLGFALYDIVHIVCALIFIALIFEKHRVALSNGEEISGNYKYEVALSLADYLTELIMSLLLIAFVVFIVKAENEQAKRRVYTFAWLLASLSLFIPSTFEMPSLYMWQETTGNLFVLQNFDLYLPLGAVIAFVAGLAFIQHPKAWRICLAVGVGFLCLFVGTSIAVYALSDKAGAGVFQQCVRYLFSLAPLIPSGFTIASLLKMTSEKE